MNSIEIAKKLIEENDKDIETFGCAEAGIRGRIEKYKSLHSAQNHWKEIRDGIRAVGILEMEIYILGTHLFMIVEVPVDFDWDEAMEKLASLPRQKEWENTVEVFQACRPGSTSSQKWQMMERIFYLYE